MLATGRSLRFPCQHLTNTDCHPTPRPSGTLLLYIAAVQSTGVPIGIWFNGPADDTGYAAVTRENISRLNDAIASLTQFPDSYAAELSERLFRNVRRSM